MQIEGHVTSQVIGIKVACPRTQPGGLLPARHMWPAHLGRLHPGATFFCVGIVALVSGFRHKKIQRVSSWDSKLSALPSEK